MTSTILTRTGECIASAAAIASFTIGLAVGSPAPAYAEPVDDCVPPPTDIGVPPPTDDCVPPPTDIGMPPPTDDCVPPPTDVGVPPPTDDCVPPQTPLNDDGYYSPVPPVESNTGGNPAVSPPQYVPGSPEYGLPYP